jgi:hypothetical protein
VAADFWNRHPRRYDAFVTDSPVDLVQVEHHHREHAINEQVNADLKDSALAHLPAGSFTANIASRVVHCGSCCGCR